MGSIRACLAIVGMSEKSMILCFPLCCSPLPTGDVRSRGVQQEGGRQGFSHRTGTPVILAHRAQHLLPGEGRRGGCWRQEQGANREPIQRMLDGAESHLFGAQTD